MSLHRELSELFEISLQNLKPVKLESLHNNVVVSQPSLDASKLVVLAKDGLWFGPGTNKSLLLESVVNFLFG